MKRTGQIALTIGAVSLAVAVVVLSRGAGEAAAPTGHEGMAGMADMPGMDMSGASADGSVRLTPQDLTTFGITFGSAEVRPLSRTVRAVGVVEFDETRIAYVAPKLGGWAEVLHVDFTGQAVRQGSPLLDVYAPELVAAQQELLLAARMLDSVGGSRVENVAATARELFASARRRLEYWDISSEQIDRVLEEGEARRTLTLYAPASGIVLEKNIFPGQAFDAGENLYVIAGLSSVWVSAEIFDADAALVREGMPVEVAIAALPGQSFTGRIDFIHPALRDQTRSMRARVALANPAGQLRPGMYATVRLTADAGEVLTVPASALLHTGERAVTFVDLGDGALLPQEVELGVHGDSLVQVLSGLEPGQRVVTSAQFLLDSESNLAEVMRAMIAQMNLSDVGGR
jgi:RND family efflux transporter MFP subunit